MVKIRILLFLICILFMTGCGYTEIDSCNEERINLKKQVINYENNTVDYYFLLNGCRKIKVDADTYAKAEQYEIVTIRKNKLISKIIYNY